MMSKAFVIRAPAGERSANPLQLLPALLTSGRGAWLGFFGAVIAIGVGWIGRDQRTLDAGDGIGYYLGIAGGAAMLLLLLYSVRKRFRFTRRLGASRYWFRAHMALGVLGPILILYHCNFNVGSLNSKVALYCTLLVAGSGLVGRFLYSRIHNGLYGRKTSLRELSETLAEGMSQTGPASGLVEDIRCELANLASSALSLPDTVWQSMMQSVSIGWKTRIAYWRLSWTFRKKLIARSLTSESVSQHRAGLERSTRKYLREHLSQIRRVAQFGAYERLFFLWHVIHVPFFFMMVLSAVVHVLAVHMY